MEKRALIRKHIVGPICAILTIIAGNIANSIYLAYSSPVEAQIAANQVTDSNTAWAVHQAIQNGMIPYVIGVSTSIIFILFLLPSIMDIVKNMNKNQ